ncbi:syntaxin 6, N-terminal-domain-containing protein [Melampsora americana]|nr:syntaxin 6, N-terminal-domain-containing protein [Melampsora americana]
MSRDPYFEVKSEVESSLISATNLFSSYKRILLTLPISSHQTSIELKTSKSELKATLSGLMADLLELNDTVKVLEDDFNSFGKSKFGLTEDEIKRRRIWVRNCEGELRRMLEEINEPEFHQSTLNSNSNTYHPLSQHFSNHSHDHQTQEDEMEAYQQEQESMIIHQQDQTLGNISGVVEVLREQASLMGREIVDQNTILEEFDQDLDLTESRLSKANQKLNQFVNENKHSKSSWCILLLILILVCLLIAIILI